MNPRTWPGVVGTATTCLTGRRGNSLTMRTLRCLLVLAALCPLLSYAGEPWSDEHLPVKEGVALWFDCSRQYAARGALKMPPLLSENETDYLIDGSGHGCHLAQPTAEARPKFEQEFTGAFLSFDGVKN